MKNLLKPGWLLIINTLPILILFFICWGQFSVVKSLLEPDSILLWTNFAIALGILASFNLIYTIWIILKKKQIHILYAFISLVGYITFLYIYVTYIDKIIPWDIPEWMLSGNLFLYVGTFLLPTLIHSLLILIIKLSNLELENKARKNFAIATSIPIVCYLFAQIILPLWQPYNRSYGMYTITIIVIALTVVFLFFLLRGIYVLSLKKSEAFQKYQLAWKIPITLILPIFGLLLNNGLLDIFIFKESAYVFGNFSNHWFYILAIANGLLICIPASKNPNIRLFLFILKSITFSFTFYFFLVFLPYLPVSVLLIVVIGLGLLTLSPLLLFVLHTLELSKDYKYLKGNYSTVKLKIIMIIGFLVIPIAITGTYFKDKKVLNAALEYVYSPDFTKEYNIDKQSILKTIDAVSTQKERNVMSITGARIPYLTPFYNYIVLDNLTLSDTKISYMERIFIGKSEINRRPENLNNSGVEITDINSKSEYDEEQNAWLSWVDLEITNDNSNSWRKEYATTIDLPAGCFISDYYLDIGDRHEMGILAEKKSAMWVFAQIRNTTNRDPGILYYLTGNRVAFRIFPFLSDEVRTTGIQFLHKDPVQLNFDGHIVSLGNSENENIQSNTTTTTDHVTYISAADKKQLDTVQREAYYHFIVDISKDKREDSKKVIQSVEGLLKNQPLNDKPKISYVNSNVFTESLMTDWTQKLEQFKFESGFFLERAIQKILFEQVNIMSNTYPIIVVVTDDIFNSVLAKDFGDYSSTFPENHLFYSIDLEGKLSEHSLIKNPKQPILDSLVMTIEDNVINHNLSVLAWPNSKNPTAYLSLDILPEIIVNEKNYNLDLDKVKEKNWLTGLEMQGQWMAQQIHIQNSDEDWISAVKASFKSRIMSPFTSYLVVENDAQKAILKKKQAQVLAGNKSLDLGEDAQRMSEPKLVWLIILLSTFLMFRNRKKIGSLIQKSNSKN